MVHLDNRMYVVKETKDRLSQNVDSPILSLPPLSLSLSLSHSLAHSFFHLLRATASVESVPVRRTVTCDIPVITATNV